MQGGICYANKADSYSSCLEVEICQFLFGLSLLKYLLRDLTRFHFHLSLLKRFFSRSQPPYEGKLAFDCMF